MERSFADAKELHGHRYARFRGLAKVQAQCLLSAACQNMKKMALLLARKAAALLTKILGQTRFAAYFARHHRQMALLHENPESALFRLELKNQPDSQTEKQNPRKIGGSSAV